MINLLNNNLLRDWFSEAFDFIPCNNRVISITGSHPFLEKDLRVFLNANGIEVVDIDDVDENTEVLIVGHADYDEEQILELLDMREGNSLRVYSQEMFFAHWTTGQDPYDDPDIVRAFADGHDALEFLMHRWVEWVTTNVVFGNGHGNFISDSPRRGVLKAAGYTVGKTNGLPSAKRHKILTDVFKSKLTNLLPSEYLIDLRANFPYHLAEWGDPNSPERLTKMRDCLSDFCRKQKLQDHTEAARDYDEDLDWLDMCIRTGRFKFDVMNQYVGIPQSFDRPKIKQRHRS